MSTAVATVRQAWPEDMPAVSEIYRHYVETTTATFEIEAPDVREWSARFWRIAETGLPFVVAEIDGRVVGYAFCKPWNARAAYRWTVEDSVYVAPSAMGRGVGSALLDSLLTMCAAAGVREVIAVVVDTGDPRSLALHRRHGFTETGRLADVGFKKDTWLDTVLLQRSLRDAHVRADGLR
ncbi:N-acetyltransferase family protein [Actinomycetes bacterium KLBMP 9759]